MLRNAILSNREKTNFKQLLNLNNVYIHTYTFVAFSRDSMCSIRLRQAFYDNDEYYKKIHRPHHICSRMLDIQ